MANDQVPDFTEMPNATFFPVCTEFLQDAADTHPHRAIWIAEAKRRHAETTEARRRAAGGYLDLGRGAA